MQSLVTGVGGIFFKSSDPERLYRWYEQHLGIVRDPTSGAAMFRWRDLHDPERVGTTVWSIFPADTRYFDPSPSPFMLNYRVDDLEAALAKLRAAGVKIDERREDAPYGRFAWIYDADGNRIELWQPPAGG